MDSAEVHRMQAQFYRHVVEEWTKVSMDAALTGEAFYEQASAGIRHVPRHTVMNWGKKYGKTAMAAALGGPTFTLMPSRTLGEELAHHLNAEQIGRLFRDAGFEVAR